MNDDKLREYFWSGKTYKDILARMKMVDGVSRSMTWLKCKFRKLGLRRRGYSDPSNELLRQHLVDLACTPYSLRGYRSVWRLFRRRGVNVRRDTVMRMMRCVDPSGVAQRRKRRLKRRMYYSKGPNYIWHLDGYDKLKPFGFCIHACIDGYSRKIIWFTLASTNNNPRVVARYFLEALEKINGCPMRVRADCGTENCLIAKIQIAMRVRHRDSLAGRYSFIYGPSTANIRIEAFWSQWRRSVCDWWISVCKSLVEIGAFNKDCLLHRYTLSFVLGELLQQDMEEFAYDWNNHLIRKNKLSKSPSGRPCDLYEVPAIHGVADYKASIDPSLWAHCMLFESARPPPLCPPEFYDNALFFMEIYLGLTKSDITHENCVQVYLDLVNLLSLILQ